MPEIKLFGQLNREEKMVFFQKCQDLLIKNQPDSPYILRTNSQRKNFFLDLYLKYNGLAYESDNVAILFNKHNCPGGIDEIHARYREKLFSPPDESPNCYSIDFVTTKMNNQLLEELNPYFNDEGIEYISFLRGSKLSVFNFQRFKESLYEKFVQ
jgi:hypothetical protein